MLSSAHLLRMQAAYQVAGDLQADHTCYLIAQWCACDSLEIVRAQNFD